MVTGRTGVQWPRVTAPAVAFLVLAHRGPEQLGRLVRRLLAPGTTVYVHVDRRTAPGVHDAIVAALPDDERVHRLARVATPWSAWGPVEATLRGLETILAGPAPPAHVVLLSGQDYPLRPAGAIAGFLAEHPGRSFVASWPMPSALYGRGGGMFRLRYWHTPMRGRRLRIPIPRRYPAGVRPYGGSAFMVLDRETARAALEFTRGRPDVARFHRHIWAVDEHHIQTAVHNSPRADAVIGENLWHMEWTPGAAHPHIFTSADFERLAHAAGHSSAAGGEARAKLFARKFDVERDARVLDRIDAELLDA
jgi:core-2/I-Branching enzyme